MTAKIRELKLEDIKTVAGGANLLSTSATFSMSTSNTTVKPISSTGLSSATLFGVTVRY